MSIIIKGLNMPKSCGGCEFNYCLEGGSYEWWECVILHDDINQFDTRRTDCPLIEIPTPHGRLIDASELDKCWEEKEDISEDVDYKILYKCVLAISKYAPTMLESEE